MYTVRFSLSLFLKRKKKKDAAPVTTQPWARMRPQLSPYPKPPNPKHTSHLAIRPTTSRTKPQRPSIDETTSPAREKGRQ